MDWSGKKSRIGWSTLSMKPLSMAIPMRIERMLFVVENRKCFDPSAKLD